MTYQASPQQQAYFDWIDNGEGSAILQAVAGAGKTSTLIEGLRRMKGSIFFGAYNKKIADEIKERAPKRDWLFISTMHGAGFKAWMRVAKNCRVNENKMRDIFRACVEQHPEYKQYEGAVLSLVSYAKQAGLGFLKDSNVYSNWSDLIEHFNVDCGGDENGEDADKLVISIARKMLEKSQKADFDQIDFDDMIYAPLFHKAKLFGHDWVLIDEAQDTNATRRALALGLLKRGGRLVAVGDKHQAIYGFTGADADALDKIAEAVNAVQIPLTVTYRCPQTVVAEAKKYVSHIEAHPTAPVGEVMQMQGKLEDNVKPGDAILCRFNAPIIKEVYKFIARGIPAKVEGREIGTGLKILAQRWKRVSSYSQLIEKLDGYMEKQTAKFRAKEKEAMVAAIEDKVNCLKVIIDRVAKIDPKPAKVVDRVALEIDAIFGDFVGKECVLLSTIHKSKGREWNKVVWLQTGPSPWARKAWEMQQEHNLCYVAVTRAKKSLVLAQAEK
jgi:DNA helicase-2/ATP-dependent DNA helicase PcrA